MASEELDILRRSGGQLDAARDEAQRAREMLHREKRAASEMATRTSAAEGRAREER